MELAAQFQMFFIPSAQKKMWNAFASLHSFLSWQNIDHCYIAAMMTNEEESKCLNKSLSHKYLVIGIL